MKVGQQIAITALGAVGALIVGICVHSKVNYGTFFPEAFIREKIIEPVIARKFLSTVERESKTGKGNVSPAAIAHNVWNKMEREGSELTKGIMKDADFKRSLWNALGLKLEEYNCYENLPI